MVASSTSTTLPHPQPDVKEQNYLPPLPPSAIYTDPKTQEVLAEWSNKEEGKAELQLFTADPFKMGAAQGVLLAPQIQAVYELQLKLMEGCHSLESDSTSLCNRVKDLKIPVGFRKELEGLLYGLGKYFEEKGGSFSPFALEDLVAVHNCTHLHANLDLNDSCVNKKSMTHMLATQVLTRKHQIANPMSGFPQGINMRTYPGFIGVISASNDYSLSLKIEGFGAKFFAMGIPHTLYARQTLERCRSVEDLEWDIYGVDNPIYRPANSHKLVATDPVKTSSFTFYGDGTHNYDIA